MSWNLPRRRSAMEARPSAPASNPARAGIGAADPKAQRASLRCCAKALERRVPDPRRGGRHTVRMIELIVEGLVLGAARRDPRMLQLLLALMDRFTPTDAPASELEEIRAADREILDEFIASVTATGRNRNGER